MAVGDILGELVLVGGAALIVLVALFVGRAHQWLGCPLALATCATSAGFVVYRMATTPQGVTWEGAFAIDGAAGWAELLILAVTALTVLLSPEWFATDARHGEWYALLLLSAAGAITMAASADTLELILGVLLSSTTGYVLAAYHRRSALSVEAGTKYFLVGALANTILLAGVTLLFGAAGTTLYGGSRGALASASGVTLGASAVLVTVGLAFKAGAVPAHSWVPDVVQGAPAPAAAFLSVAPKVGGLVALARLMLVMPEAAVGWRPMIAGVAALTMTVGNLSALWQDDVRRLLGWSSVSQAGYALMAVAVLGRSDRALAALLYFLTAYAAGQMAAFGVVTELRGRTALEDYRGLAQRRPWLAVAFTIAVLSFVGVPPLAGFGGKLLLFTATVEGGYAWLAVVAVANTVASLFYYLRVVAPATLEPAPAAIPVLGRWAAVATAAAAGLVVALGLVAQPLVAGALRARLLL